MVKILIAILVSVLGVLGVFANPFEVFPFKAPKQYEASIAKYRSSWSRMTGFEHSGLHWQQFVVIFINKDSQVYRDNYYEYLKFYQDNDDEDIDELDEPEFSKYSPGTVVVKENYAAKNGSPDTPLHVTMMIKHEPGYDPEFGDWEYVQFNALGDLILSGNSKDPAVKEACANCHINIAERDYIFSNFYSKSITD